MTVSQLRPRHQERSIIIDKIDAGWRTTIFPPAAELEAAAFPLISDFALADEALGYAAKLASMLGWKLVDLSGKRSADELLQAIDVASAIGENHEAAASDLCLRGIESLRSSGPCKQADRRVQLLAHHRP